MKKLKLWKFLALPILALGIGLETPNPALPQTDNLVTVNAAVKKHHHQHKKAVAAASSQSQTDEQLASLDYQGTQVIMVNNNQPTFNTNDLSTSQGAWQQYGDLDSYNRATQANAMLNKSLMPHTKREPLTVNPTGWHNKRIKGGYLYNRSHLIGYQLTGQNNNWKNLITGTRSLNDPEMLRYEDDVADYLKANPQNYVRYQVTPIFRGNELLARGVHMQAQSVGSNAISYNVYIFNVQDGVNLNYNDGTSTITSSAASTSSAVASSTAQTNTIPEAQKNQRTVYVTPYGKKYHYDRNCRALSRSKTVSTMTESQAQASGYTLCGFEK